MKIDSCDRLLELAIEIAKQAHTGQVDKAGQPYIDHPLWVMQQVKSPEAKIVAVLHDAVEDSDLSIEALKARGFPEIITDAVAAITKLENESYEDYLGRVMSNPIALRVKIADVTHNLDISRIPQPTAKDIERLEKYRTSLQSLKEALGHF